MKYEVIPITMTALAHCMHRVTSCSGRATVLENMAVVDWTGGDRWKLRSE